MFVGDFFKVTVLAKKLPRFDFIEHHVALSDKKFFVRGEVMDEVVSDEEVLLVSTIHSRVQ